MTEECIFCKIGSGSIPVDAIYQDEEFIAFHDLNPQAPVHALLIPRAHFPTLLDVTDSNMMGRALVVVNQIARKLNIHESGYRVVINTRDDGGQTVYHLHFHILGGRFMSWPPG